MGRLIRGLKADEGVRFASEDGNVDAVLTDYFGPRGKRDAIFRVMRNGFNTPVEVPYGGGWVRIYDGIEVKAGRTRGPSNGVGVEFKIDEKYTPLEWDGYTRFGRKRYPGQGFEIELDEKCIDIWLQEALGTASKRGARIGAMVIGRLDFYDLGPGEEVELMEGLVVSVPPYGDVSGQRARINVDYTSDFMVRAANIFRREHM